MSGLVKAKKYDWKDSNMALFGSDTEKKVKSKLIQAQRRAAGETATRKLSIYIIILHEIRIVIYIINEVFK